MPVLDSHSVSDFADIDREASFVGLVLWNHRFETRSDHVKIAYCR